MKYVSTLLLLVALGACGQEYPEKIYTVKGLAIKGYDPVAYFSEGEAILGTETHSLVWKESKWLFSSAENKKRFQENPEKYAPQYGGYCAYGMGNGYKAKVDPESAWSIVDGKLYLNYNLKVKATWEPAKADWIEKANKNWKKFED